MFWVLIGVGVIVAMVVLVVVIGMILPKEHRASSTCTFASPPQEVWNTITDFANTSGWRTGLKSVQALPERNGHAIWKETDQSGQAITYETLEIQAPTKFVRRIADDKLPFGGTWTIHVKPSGQTTSVEIVEDGVVFNPVFRFVSKFIMGHTRSMNQYLGDLRKRLESGSQTSHATPSRAAN